ncbi:MAG TPA: VOC family protein [Fibrobacteria bacterium]|nr:VOC family protein [Fibrobacteria bacterium]
MQVVRSGVILKTERQQECVEFYREVMGLYLLFADDFLTCFAWSGAYLMIEPLGQGDITGSQGNLVLRFHVDDIGAQKARLEAMGVPLSHAKFDWGEILSLEDPAGNRIELKDAATFEQQIRQGH